MKLKLGKYYLIHQQWQYGSDIQNNILVVKYTKKASESDNENYSGKDGYWGKAVKDGDVYYFELDEVISSIKI